MAKKETTISDAVAEFISIMDRCQFISFKYENRIIYTTNPKKKNTNTVFIPDEALWLALTENENFMKKCKELDPTNANDRIILERLSFTKDMDTNWIEIDNNSMANDDRIYIKLDGFEYKIEINKTIWPLRFKKNEFGNFSYRIFNKPFPAFAIRKKFISNIEGGSFYMLRIFQII